MCRNGNDRNFNSKGGNNERYSRRRCYQENRKEEVLKMLNIENILYANERNGILFDYNNTHYFWADENKKFDTDLFYSKHSIKVEIGNKHFIECYEVPKFIKKLPHNEKEFYQFFKDIYFGIDGYFYDNLLLQDIYYSLDDKKYIILAPYYDKVPKEVNIHLSNLFQNKSVYTYKDSEIKTPDDLDCIIGGDFNE